MGNSYQRIDFETWKRKEYCQIYRTAVQPQYCVSFELDVTNFKKHVKENKALRCLVWEAITKNNMGLK